MELMKRHDIIVFLYAFWNNFAFWKAFSWTVQKEYFITVLKKGQTDGREARHDGRKKKEP
jgi:hypothetical protein